MSSAQVENPVGCWVFFFVEAPYLLQSHYSHYTYEPTVDGSVWTVWIGMNDVR